MRRPRVGTVLAHPDDETFGLGGTLIRAVERGGEVHSLCLTRGEAGSLGDPQAPLTTRERLGEVRAEELREAGLRMGLASVTVLDWGDGGMNGDRGLPTADPRAVEDGIVEWLRAHPLDTLVTWGPDGGYRHPDHIAAGERCVAALERMPEVKPRRVYRMVLAERQLSRLMGLFPDWDVARTLRAWQDEELGAIVTLTDEEIARKRHAMQAHRSQLPDLRRFEMAFAKDPDVARWETFIRWWPPQELGRLDTELF